MSFLWRNISTSLSFRCVVFSRPSISLTNHSLGLMCKNNDLILSEFNLYKSYTRSLTKEAKTFETAFEEVTKESAWEKNEWGVEKLPEEDRFGTLNTSQDEYELKMFEEVYEVTKEDQDEASDSERVHRGRKNTPIWYGNQMKKLLKEGKLKEALDVLEVRMLKEDLVQPTEFNYNVLIGGCGRAGFTKKAFRLYNDMKKRGLQPSAVTFTALFNACAESPWPEADGITRLKKLHEQLREKEIGINLVTHHAMMKAYAKCGDIQTAFKLFHHLLESGVKLSVDSFVFLFFACASQKESGFVYAIEGWRHMLLKGIQPSLTTYNILLRIVRDCGVGDIETANQVLLNSPKLNKKMLSGVATVKQRRVVKQKLKKGKQQKLQQLEVLKVSDERTANTSEDLFLQNMSLKNNTFLTHSKDHGNSGKQKCSDKRERDLESSDNSKNDLESSDNQNDLFHLNLSDQLVAHSDTASLTDIAPVSARVTSNLPNMLSLNPNLEGILSLTSMETPADRLSLLGGTRGLVESMTSYDVKPDCKTLTLLAEIIPKKQVAEAKLLKVVDDLEVKVDVDFYNMLIRKRTKRNNLAAAKALLVDIKLKGLYPSMRTYVALASGCTQQDDGLQLLQDVKNTGQTPALPLYNALISAAHTQKNYDYAVDILKDMEETKVWPNKRTITQLEKMAGFGAKQKKANPKLNGFRGFYTSWLERISYQNEQHPWRAYKNTD